MPKASNVAAGGDARVPRTLWGHAHTGGNNAFPAPLFNGIFGEVFLILPDNWKGVDKLVLWFRGTGTGAGQCDMDFNAGTCNELFNIHTISLADQVVNVVVNEYECVDVTAAVAAWIAALNARDVINIRVDDDNEIGIQFIGAEIQET